MKTEESLYTAPEICVIDIIAESGYASSSQLENYFREEEKGW